MEARNFIEEFINADLESGKISTTQTRFPPEPNGYLHIGHAKSLCINFGIKEKYQGLCNLRFDDTNPVKEDIEYVDAIKEDIKWLGFDWDRETYASDFFEDLYNMAIVLIKKGLAFVCDYTADEIRATRGNLVEGGKDSPSKTRSIEENLDLFARMRAGEFPDGSKTLRAKIDMSSPNMNMRDPVIYRILRATHHRTGDTWCIYPMYDFTHPLCDAIESITHSICTLEFEDHRPAYDWFVHNCDVNFVPHQYEFARLNITKCIMSKRYLKKLVDDKVVEGWDDPRMPTICGLRRRGYTPHSLRDFCERIGVAKSNSELDIRNLEACVREDLNANAIRVMAVLNPLKVTLTNYNENSETLTVANHPGNPDMGDHEVTFTKDLFIDKDDFSLTPPPKYRRLTKGGFVRLKGAYIIQCNDVVLDEKGEVCELLCEYLPETKSGSGHTADPQFKKVGTIQFVDANNAYEFTAREYEYLLNDEEFAGQDFSERINTDSMHEYKAVGEAYLKDAQFGSRFQFMRMGYFIKDEKSDTFGEIVSLKDSFKL